MLESALSDIRLCRCYVRVMIRLTSLLRGFLLLMLAAGPLQAQTVLLCEMMEVPRQETCCCHDAETAREADADTDTTCDRPSCHTTPRAQVNGCCDQAVEVSFEPDDASPITKPPMDRADLNLPIPLLVAFELQPPPSPPVRIVTPPRVSVATSLGTHLYLRTERLRI